MKTLNVKSLLFLIMLAFAVPSVASATAAAPVENPSEQRANQLNNRLEEIRAMNMKTLSRKEKKALRGEVRAIKKEMAEISGGVYLSVGAIILIVLLIILLA
jgi:hypothetical protein